MASIPCDCANNAITFAQQTSSQGLCRVILFVGIGYKGPDYKMSVSSELIRGIKPRLFQLQWCGFLFGRVMAEEKVPCFNLTTTQSLTIWTLETYSNVSPARARLAIVSTNHAHFPMNAIFLVDNNDERYG